MADPKYPAAPQEFSFGGRRLVGQLLSWSGQSQRRHVVHEFPKRAGAIVEDMQRGPRRLEVRLVFLGDSCAKDFADFERAVDSNPKGLLVHPIAGKWQAFCGGPSNQVNFATAINQIDATVSFVETTLDATIQKETPDVATAAQNATAQQTKFQATCSKMMGELAKAQTFVASSLAKIDTALALVDTLEAPLDFMSETITALAGVSQQAIGAVLSIQAKGNALSTAVTNYVTGATDLFNGGDVPAAQADQTATLLGVVLTASDDLTEALIAGSTTPAGAGEAVGDTEEMASYSLVLAEALKAARPPEILITVTELTDLVSLCVKRYPVDPLARASDILGLNRILNPAAIPAGTRLRAPSR